MSATTDFKEAKIKTLTKTATSTPELNVSGQSLVGDIAQGASFVFDVYQQQQAKEQATALQQELTAEENLISGSSLKLRELRQVAKEQKLSSIQLRKRENELLGDLSASQRLEVISTANKLTGETFKSVTDTLTAEQKEAQDKRDTTVMALAEVAPFVEPVDGVDLGNVEGASTEDLNKLLVQATITKARHDKNVADKKEALSRKQEERAAGTYAQSQADKVKEEKLVLGGLEFRTNIGREMLRNMKGTPISDDPQEVALQIDKIDVMKEDAINRFQAMLADDDIVASREEVTSELKPMLDIMEGYKSFLLGEDTAKISKNQREAVTEGMLKVLARDEPTAYASLLLSSKGLINSNNRKHLTTAMQVSDDFFKTLGSGGKQAALERLKAQGYSEKDARDAISLAVDMTYSKIGELEPAMPLTPEEKKNNSTLVYNTTDVNSPEFEENLKNGNTKKTIDKVIVGDSKPEDFPDGQYDKVMSSALNATERMLVMAATRVKAGEIGWDGERFVPVNVTSGALVGTGLSQATELNKMLEGYASKGGKNDIKLMLGMVINGE